MHGTFDRTYILPLGAMFMCISFLLTWLVGAILNLDSANSIDFLLL